MQPWEKLVEDTLNSGSAFIGRHLVTTKTTYHSHNFVEIAYVAKGNGTHNINGVEHDVSEGDIFLINYDIKHEFITKNEPLLLYNCIFTPSYFDLALKESRNFFDITDHFLLNNLYANFPTDYIFTSAHGGENHHILNINERMFQEFTMKQLGYRDIIRGYIIEFLVIICRLKLNVASERTKKMLEIMEYINVHYKENIYIENLAAIAGFSTSHFRSIFKSLTGKPVSLYIQNLRVQEACKILKNKDINVEQVAMEVGYSDIKHFYSVFKKITGKRPKDFR